MKSVGVGKHQRDEDYGGDEEEIHGGSGVLEDDVRDDVSGVTAAVHRLLVEGVKVF